MSIDMYRGTAGVSLPSELSAEVWAGIQEQSAIMRSARQVALPGNGVTIPVITADPAATFVAETDRKNVAVPTVTNKLMSAHTIAVIVPFSNQFKRDLPSLYGEIVRRLPGSLGKAFDAEVFKSSTSLPNFDVLGDATSKVVDGTATYADLVTVLTTIGGNNAELTDWIASPALHALMLTAADSLGRPFFVPNPAGQGSVGSVFGAPVHRTTSTMAVANSTGFAGDFKGSAVYGTVEGVKIAISDNASLTESVETFGSGSGAVDIPVMYGLWERNMFAVRAEIEVGFRVRDKNAFVLVKSS